MLLLRFLCFIQNSITPLSLKRVGMKIIVIHHAKPYHLDDYLAVSLLLYKYKNQIERKEIKNPNEIDLENLKKQYDLIIFVDIGNRYEINDKIRFYDHHHNINIPCSLILILKHEFPKLYEKVLKIEPIRKLIEYIDVRDRFGEAKAHSMFGICETFPLIRFLMSILMSEPNVVIGENFINLIESYYKVYETSKLYNIDDVKVVINYGDPREVPVSVICDVFNPDMIIQKNVREPDKISVVKNQYSPLYDKINLEKLREILPVTFIHPNKFMCVIAKSINEVNEEFVKKIILTSLSQ